MVACVACVACVGSLDFASALPLKIKGASEFLRKYVQNGAMTPRDELTLLDFVDKHDGVELALQECNDYCSGAAEALRGYRGCQSGPGWDGIPDSEAHELLAELLGQFPLREANVGI